MKRVIFVAIVMVLFRCGSASALEPPTKEQIEDYRQKGTLAAHIANAKALGNHLVSQRLVDRSSQKLRQMFLQNQGLSPSEIDQILAPPLAWRGMPTSGTVKILALLIAFSDYPESNTASSVETKLCGDGSGGVPYESLRNYYRRSSYHKLEIQGNVLGWYTTAYPRSDVPQTTQGRQNLIKEALNYYDGLGHDFTQYDNDGDGAIDYLVVFWTGPDNGWSNFWWGYMTTFADSSYRLDGKRLDTYSWQWEARPSGGTFSPRVVIHETGHALGLPDYYDYDDTVGPNGGVGGLDMMDGNWGDHNCFSKFLLDWIVPSVYKVGVQGLTLNPSGTSEDAIVAMPGALQGDQFGEFFMIQNRYRTANDATYPTNSGLLVWHVDARLNRSGTNFLYNNSYTEHKLLRLMEADGLEEIETGDGNADAGDYYVAGKVFDTNTTPNSKRYNETSTGVKIDSISPSGNLMNLVVSIPNRAVDFDMDGEIDIAVYRTSIGAWFIDPSDGAPIYRVGFGGDGSDVPVPGDYDGDGKTDVAIYRVATGGWFIYPSGGAAIYGVGFGGDGSDVPVPGDYDGDGKTDIAIYRVATGGWFIYPSGGAPIYGVGFGGDGSDVPVPGDYDGDGMTDIAIYRVSTGGWFIYPSGGAPIYGVGFGGNVSDKPVPGDYDGDGITDIAIYRVNAGAWFINPSGGGSVYGVGFGGDASDLPVTSNLASNY